MFAKLLTFLTTTEILLYKKVSNITTIEVGRIIFAYLKLLEANAPYMINESSHTSKLKKVLFEKLKKPSQVHYRLDCFHLVTDTSKKLN